MELASTSDRTRAPRDLACCRLMAVQHGLLFSEAHVLHGYRLFEVITVYPMQAVSRAARGFGSGTGCKPEIQIKL